MFKSLVRAKNRLFETLARRPIVSFFVLLAVLFGLIALTHFLRTPKPEGEAKAPEAKSAEAFVIGTDTATLSVPAEIKKDGVVRIVALSPGIVSGIYASAGSEVGAGQVLFEITNDYGSGVAALQKQVAENTAASTEELAKIDKRIFELEEKKAKHDDTLTDTEEDIELQNLKKDRAARRTTLENNDLNLAIALRNDAALKPKTLVSGTVERVNVRRGQFVAAGTVLATVRNASGNATLETLVSHDTLSLFDPSKPAIAMIGGQRVELAPLYFSEAETGNGLYSILFALPESALASVTNGGYLRIELPMKSASLESMIVPIDTVFQDDAHAWVLVDEDGMAVSKEVTLGNIYGNFAEIVSGLDQGAHVITNRSVIAGDHLQSESR